MPSAYALFDRWSTSIATLLALSLALALLLPAALGAWISLGQGQQGAVVWGVLLTTLAAWVLLNEISLVTRLIRRRPKLMLTDSGIRIWKLFGSVEIPWRRFEDAIYVETPSMLKFLLIRWRPEHPTLSQRVLGAPLATIRLSLLSTYPDGPEVADRINRGPR
jgi:hypothetical protein